MGKAAPLAVVWLVASALLVAAGSAAAGAASPAFPVTRTVDAGVTALPAPPIRSLDVVAFPSTNTGYAAGRGDLLATRDGGTRWTTLALPFSHVDALAFASPMQGWAGGPGTLAGTADGGRTWQMLAAPATGPFGLAAFAGGTLFAWAGAPGGFYRSLDGGRTWQALATPQPVGSACFINPATGFVAAPATAAAGATVWATRDAGETWSAVLHVTGASATEVTALGCAAPGTVWAVVAGGSSMSQTSYAVYASTDDAVVWQELAAVSTAGGGPAPGPGSPAAAAPETSPGPVALAGGESGYVLGHCQACDIGSWQAGGLGPRGTWTNGSSLPLDAASAALASPAPADLWVVSDAYGSGSAAPGVPVVLHSADAGQTWHVAWQGMADAPVGQMVMAGGGTVYGLGSVTDPSALFRSSDGGRLWRTLPDVPGSSDRIVRADGRVVWLSDIAPSGAERLWASLDGGGTWRQVRAPWASAAWFDAAFSGPVGCVGTVTVTYGGLQTFETTVNGGASWRVGVKARSPSLCLARRLDPTLVGPLTRALAQGLYPQAVSLVGRRDAWLLVASRSGMTLLSTLDGGRSFRHVVWPAGAGPLQSVTFVSARQGWVTAGNVLYETTDGGRRWQGVAQRPTAWLSP